MSTKSLQLSEDFTKRYSTNKNLLNIDIQNKEDLLNDCKNYLYAIMIDMYYSTNYLETIIRDLIVLSSIKFRPDSDLTEVGYIKSDYTDNITESIESIIDNADDILRYKVYKEILSKNEVQKETSNSES